MVDPLFRGAPGRIVRVALPLPIDSLFSYEVPDALNDEARVGCRAVVPFSGRRLTGVIVEALAGSDDTFATGTLAAVERVIDPEPALSTAMLAILREAADHVLCPLGIALASALPAGTTPRIRRELTITPRGRAAIEGAVAHGEPRRILELLAKRAHPAATLVRGSRDSEAALRDLVRDGLATPVEVEVGPSARLARTRFARIADGVDVDVACREQLSRARAQAELLRRIERAGEIELSELARERRGASSIVRTLAQRDLVCVEERVVERDVLGPVIERDAPVTLTADQSSVLAPILDALRAGRNQTFLLHGVTGSGKTEVYLRAVAEALAAGRQALVLVPEITLTHQIVARLRARFGDALAVLHSGLRPSERLDQWHRLRRGATPIAVGARSALFAPIENPGVIVIDEEHDSAYKNDEGFRYHARQLAELRARAAGCPVVLGSATPSLESRHAAERGDIRRLVLPRRIGGRPLPVVELVDLARERDRAPRGRKLIVTRPLKNALAETLESRGQSILLLNRRGFSTQIFCFDCGFAERCKDCDVALVYHAREGRLQCHYCDFQKPPPEVCGGCGAPDTALLGVGTERLEEEVRTLFPEARLARLDRDTASRRGHTERVLRGLHDGEIDILMGTQMVAKGHDFPGVRLVGVIAADLGLHLPDFRAAERTFQLLTQVAGRAGRNHQPGRVVVQTFVPDHYAIQPVLRHDYETFYREEIEQRAALGYPPLGLLFQVMVSSRDEAECRATAAGLAAEVRDPATADAIHAARGCEVLGPAPAPLPRLRARYRYQILVKGRDAGVMRAAAERVAAAIARLPRSVSAALDVAPGNML